MYKPTHEAIWSSNNETSNKRNFSSAPVVQQAHVLQRLRKDLGPKDLLIENKLTSLVDFHRDLEPTNPDANGISKVYTKKFGGLK